MALRQREQANTLLGGTRYNNQEGGIGSRVAGKARLNSSSARSALGNISNKNASTAVGGTISIKNGAAGNKPRTKSTGVSSLKSIVDKENPMLPPKSVKDTEEALKEELRQMKPIKDVVASPMDTSNQVSHSSQMLPPNVTDIDQDDSENPQLVSEYVNDIYDYMHQLERQQSIRPKFLEGQEINGRMRSILYDWLVQVHLRFHLLQETLYLTTAIIDRFLQVQEVSKNKLQLVGVTAMLIASKYEEMYAPEVADFVYITDNAYSKAEIRNMECCILRTLDFSLGRPLPLHFLRRNSKAGDVDANHHSLAKYLMELTLIDYELAHRYPSEIAAAALRLSMKLYDDAEWNETLQYYSKYSEEHLQPIIQRMAQLVLKAGSGKCTAIKTKYMSSKFMKISSAPQLKSKLITDLAAEAS